MRRMVLIALTLLVPMAGSAAAQGGRGDGERPIALNTAGPAASPSTALRLPAGLSDPFRFSGATGDDADGAASTDGTQQPAGGRNPAGGTQLPPTTMPPRDTAPPPPDPNSSRRRGSMVGYIEDTLVGTKLRVRFDVGLNSDTPDRAEFFYGKCGCYRTLAVTDPGYDPNAAGPGPGIVDHLNFEQLYLQGEYAVNERFSIFGELPIRWLQPDFVENTGSFDNQGGISDLRAGAKLALTATAERALTAQVKMYLPTGDALKGLGTDHASIEPAVLYYQQLSDRASLESMVSVWLPFGGSDAVPTSLNDKFAGNVLSYGVGPSFDVYRGRGVRFSPVVELVGWRVLSGYQTPGGDASGTNIVNLKFGARASWGRGGSVYFGYGRALTDAVWYNDIFRFEYRVSF